MGILDAFRRKTEDDMAPKTKELDRIEKLVPVLERRVRMLEIDSESFIRRTHREIAKAK